MDISEIKKQKLLNLYNKYIKECNNLTDIKRWSTKKTVTGKVLESDRTNEAKVRDALGEGQFQEGDKIRVYYIEDKSLKLEENWNGDHDKFKLMEMVYKTTETFDSVIDLKDYIKYHLKTKRKFLDNLG